jgi:hypothetical protein
MLRPMRRAWSTSVICAGLVACGGNGDATTSSGSGGSSSSGGGPQPITCTGAPADPALDGTWVAQGKLAISLKGAPSGTITICPANQIGESDLTLLITVQTDPMDSSKLTAVHANVCSITLPTSTALVGQCDPASKSIVTTQLIVPPAFLAALPKVVTMPVMGSVTGKGNGAPIALDRLSVTLGTNKSGGVLPLWDADPNNNTCLGAGIGHTSTCETMCVDDCPAMTDDDGDTFPGVTFQVCGRTDTDTKGGVPCNADNPINPGVTLQGKAFVAFQVDPLFTGTAKSSCEVLGTIDTTVRYSIVGDDVYLSGNVVSVDNAINSLPAFTVDPAQSKFRMVRIDGKYGAPNWNVDPASADAACATLRKRINEL